MLYAILIYTAEGIYDRLPEEAQAAAMDKHRLMQETMSKRNALGAVAKLMNTSAAVSLRNHNGAALVTDGPFAESKEQLLGLYMIECASMDEAIEATKILPIEISSYEIRPVEWANEAAAGHALASA